MGSEKLGTCAGFCECYKVPHPKRLCTGDNWREQPQGEATRPVNRSLDVGLVKPVQTEGGEFQELPAANEKAQLRPSSPPATAAHNKYFVDRTPEGWGIFYTEPAAPETGRACIGGSKDEHIARLRCQILNSHLADVLEAVEFAKTQERLTERCQCVGEWKAGCPVHDAESSAPAGTARELRSKAFTISAAYLPAIDDQMTVVDIKDAEAYADQRVRPLQTSLAKLYAAIGPMDELDTVDDAVARVEKLRQEQDALDKNAMHPQTETRWQEAIYQLCRKVVGPEHEDEIDGSGCDSGDALDVTLSEIKQAIGLIRDEEREARERAEKALREATDAIRWALGSNGDFTERKAGQGPYWWRTELRERSERALASLKSSEGAK